MSWQLRALVAAGLLLGLAGAPVRAQDQDQEKSGPTVENPYYKFWRDFKVGSTAICRETTKMANPDSKLWTPDGADEKRVAYKLIEADDKRVVVEMVVTEREFLGHFQAAPTRYIYPAKVRKQDLERFFQETGAKTGEDTLKVDGQEVKVKTVEGTIKSPSGEETNYKLWLSTDVPGSIVKKVRTTRQKGEVVAETTITLESCKKAD